MTREEARGWLQQLGWREETIKALLHPGWPQGYGARNRFVMKEIPVAGGLIRVTDW